MRTNVNVRSGLRLIGFFLNLFAVFIFSAILRLIDSLKWNSFYLLRISFDLSSPPCSFSDSSADYSFSASASASSLSRIELSVVCRQKGGGLRGVAVVCLTTLGCRCRSSVFCLLTFGSSVFNPSVSSLALSQFSCN